MMRNRWWIQESQMVTRMQMQLNTQMSTMTVAARDKVGPLIVIL